MDSSLNNIFDYEKQLFSKLQSYNTAYTNYYLCSKYKKNCDIADTSYNVNLQKSEISTTISNLDNVIKYYGELSDKKTNGQYDASLNELKNNYQHLLKFRSDIDTQLMELYDNPASISNSHFLHVNSAVYINLLWTVLATSIIFIVFTKL